MKRHSALALVSVAFVPRDTPLLSLEQRGILLCLDMLISE